jgi:hypothetical protein
MRTVDLGDKAASDMGNEAEVKAVLHSFGEDEVIADAFHSKIVALAFDDPHLVFRLGAKLLGSEEAPLRAAAAHAIGRAAEAGDESLARIAEKTVIEQLKNETSGAAVEALAIGLLHVWGRLDDPKFTRQLAFARESNPSLRIAAAQSLALSAPTPLPAFLESILKLLSQDSDPEVQRWAQVGLEQP